MSLMRHGMLFFFVCYVQISSACATCHHHFHIDQKKILKYAPNLSSTALRYAIKGYKWAQVHSQVNKPVLTVVDFSLPSYKKRMWVIDLTTSKTLIYSYTSQGKNSGAVYAEHFSNRVGSDETSLGVYKVTAAYNGAHGRSLHLQGLERGINDHAARREIVIHPAWYATQKFVARYHRVGRSWGCFAISPSVDKKFIHFTEDGSILFAYALPEQRDRVI